MVLAQPMNWMSVVGTGTANELDVVITNRATAQITTIDATLTPIITLPLGATQAVFSVGGTVTVIIPSTGAGASYDFSAAIKTSGVASTEIGAEYPTTFEDTSLSTANIFFVASGNNAVLQVLGVAGTTINWDAYLTFRQVS